MKSKEILLRRHSECRLGRSFTSLFYTLLSHIILYYSMLYYTILYYTILYDEAFSFEFNLFMHYWHFSLLFYLFSQCFCTLFPLWLLFLCSLFIPFTFFFCSHVMHTVLLYRLFLTMFTAHWSYHDNYTEFSVISVYLCWIFYNFQSQQ